jgi:5-methylcytosine-specific restriction endonuclease McrA
MFTAGIHEVFPMVKRQRFTDDRLQWTFDRTRGKCHVCHGSLVFGNYGRRGRRGAWHVEHSVAIAKGGTHHGNNLYAAHITCNGDKSTVTSRTARRWNGKRRAPLSAARYAEAKRNTVVGAGAVGLGVGAMILGVPGAIIGTIIGAAFGSSIDPDE